MVVGACTVVAILGSSAIYPINHLCNYYISQVSIEGAGSFNLIGLVNILSVVIWLYPVSFFKLKI